MQVSVMAENPLLPSLLLIEDDEVDTESFIRAIKKNNISNPLFFACDGVEALEFLTGSNGKEKIQPPYVIFLDINMPRMNGLEFLEEMRRHDELKKNIVFVLTTSTRPTDIDAAYAHNVAGYIVKNNVLDLAELLHRYLQCNEFLPSPEGGIRHLFREFTNNFPFFIGNGHDGQAGLAD